MSNAIHAPAVYSSREWYDTAGAPNLERPMSDGLKALPRKFLTENERFSESGIESPLSVQDYWRWSASSLMDNTARGLVAEFLVATALRGDIADQPRVDMRARGGTDTDNWRFRVIPREQLPNRRPSHVERLGAVVADSREGGPRAVRIRALAGAHRRYGKSSGRLVGLFPQDRIARVHVSEADHDQIACDDVRAFARLRTCWGPGSSGRHPEVRTSTGARLSRIVRGRANQRRMPASL